MTTKMITPKEWGEGLDPPVQEEEARALVRRYSKKIKAQKVGRAWILPENARDPRVRIWRKKK